MVRLVACAAVSGIFALLVGCSGEDSPSEPPVSTGGTVSTGGGSGGTLPTGGAPATGGTDPGPMVELELPIERDGKYVLEFGDLLFEVDPNKGGRVTRFELNGYDVIADAGVTGDGTNSGSTFWPSPQSGWYPNSDTEWPPIASIDSDAYSASLEGTTIVLRSPAPDHPDRARVSVVKRFQADLEKEAIVCTFELKNEADQTVSWAPWQVTRVGPNGLSFFTTGSEVVYDRLDTTESAGITWFDHPAGVPNPLPGWPDSPKLSVDVSEPWLAHVAGNVVFVKTFPAVSPSSFAPGHGEVELYATSSYMEIEVQGPYTMLAPGQSLQWTVRWMLRELPSGVSATPGNTALVDFVRDLVQ